MRIKGLLIIVLFVMLLSASAAAASTVSTAVAALPAEVVTESTYPVTPAENPDIAQQRAFVAAMRLAHAKWVEYAGKMPDIIKKNYSIAQLYVAVEAMNRSSLLQSDIKTINGGKFYRVKLKNVLDTGNINIITGNMADSDYVPFIRLIHNALNVNNEAITELRLRYIYSKSAVDRAGIKEKIITNEKRFVSTEWTFYGFVAYINNQTDTAGADFEKAVSSDPSNANAYYARGLYYAATGHKEKAIADYSEALKTEPRNFDLYSRRARMYSLCGDDVKAIDDYSSCLKLQPDSVKMYLARAALYDKSGKEEQALADYNKVLVFDPKNYQALQSRAEVLEQLKKYDAAIADFSSLIATGSDDAVNFLGRGSCYEARGETAKALADYEKAMSCGSGDSSKFIDLAQKSYDNKQYDLSERAAGIAIDLNRENAQAYIIRARSYDARQKYAAAIADYSEAVRLRPGDAQLLLYRAADYAAMTTKTEPYYKQAIADCSAALVLDANLYDAYFIRGKMFQYQSEYKQAIADYTVCLAKKPAAAVYSNMGECYAALGDKNKPRECFNAAIRLDGSNPQYYWNLANFFDKINRAKSDTIRAYNDFVRIAGTDAQWSEQVAFAKARVVKLGGKTE